MNRIQAAIEHIDIRLASQLACGATSPAHLNELTNKLNIDLTEYFHFQNVKSLAFANGKLSLDEAQLIYNILGKTANDFNNQPLPVKIVVTKTMVELMK